MSDDFEKNGELEEELLEEQEHTPEIEQRQSAGGDADSMRILEALLFASDELLTPAKLKSILPGTPDARQIRKLVDKINIQLQKERHPFEIVEIGGGYQFRTVAYYHPWVRQIFKEKAAKKLSGQALECLAIIAYKQPLSKAEIEAIRGVISDGAMKTLLEKRLVTISGRSDKPGRPLLYTTTTEFLTYFGLNKIADLPRIEEFEAIAREKMEDLSVDELKSEETVLSEEESEITDKGSNPSPENSGQDTALFEVNIDESAEKKEQSPQTQASTSDDVAEIEIDSPAPAATDSAIEEERESESSDEESSEPDEENDTPSNEEPEIFEIIPDSEPYVGNANTEGDNTETVQVNSAHESSAEKVSEEVTDETSVIDKSVIDTMKAAEPAQEEEVSFEISDEVTVDKQSSKKQRKGKKSKTDDTEISVEASADPGTEKIEAEEIAVEETRSYDPETPQDSSEKSVTAVETEEEVVLEVKIPDESKEESQKIEKDRTEDDEPEFLIKN